MGRPLDRAYGRVSLTVGVMRPLTAVLFGVSILLLGGAVAFGAGFFGGGTSSTDAGLDPLWVSDTGRESLGNHHAVAAGRVDGRGVVFVPISGRADTTQCDLVAFDATNGKRLWNYPIPPANCTIHAVADPTIGDYDGDGTTEVFAATTEQAVLGFDATTGEPVFRHNLTSYGYTQPLVTDLIGDQEQEVIVVDVKGTVFVLGSNGSTVWRRQLGAYTWGQPAVADFDGDGGNELVVGLGGSGGLYLLEADGAVQWNRTKAINSSITWMSTGQADDDPAVEIVIATVGGKVTVVDGKTGAVQWQRDFGSFAAVHAFGDGDGDSEPEIYAVARDGMLRSLRAADGETEWETTLTTEDVQMTPPPSLGDVDGDGRPELVAVTNTGVVALVDPRTGEVIDSYRRDVPIWVHPTLADIDADDVPEVFITYGDARVVALSGAGR